MFELWKYDAHIYMCTIFVHKMDKLPNTCKSLCTHFHSPSKCYLPHSLSRSSLLTSSHTPYFLTDSLSPFQELPHLVSAYSYAYIRHNKFHTQDCISCFLTTFLTNLDYNTGVCNGCHGWFFYAFRKNYNLIDGSNSLLCCLIQVICRFNVASRFCKYAFCLVYICSWKIDLCLLKSLPL